MEQRKITITKDNIIIEEHTFSSAEKMMEFAFEFLRRLKGGDVLLLSGELGAGKTTFTKGLARGLGVVRDVTSPTFVIMNLYNVDQKKQRGIFSLCHIDAYRLSSEKELLALGADEYIGGEHIITVLEWPERVYTEYSKSAYFIVFELV